MPKLTINGQAVEVPAGTNLIEAARKVGVEVPHYCYHPALSIAGQCRLCMVDIEKTPRPTIACNTPASDRGGATGRGGPGRSRRAAGRGAGPCRARRPATSSPATVVASGRVGALPTPAFRSAGGAGDPTTWGWTCPGGGAAGNIEVRV